MQETRDLRYALLMSWSSAKWLGRKWKPWPQRSDLAGNGNYLLIMRVSWDESILGNTTTDSNKMGAYCRESSFRRSHKVLLSSIRGDTPKKLESKKLGSSKQSLLCQLIWATLRRSSCLSCPIFLFKLVLSDRVLCSRRFLECFGAQTFVLCCKAAQSYSINKSR